MAIDLNTSDEAEPIASINVTPFVDVVLVLLVIFMVTAPIISKELLEVNLPKAASGKQTNIQSIGIVITQQGQILLNGKQVSPIELAYEIKQGVSKNAELQAVISADGESKHSDVVKAIDIIKSSGLSKFALQVQRME